MNRCFQELLRRDRREIRASARIENLAASRTFLTEAQSDLAQQQPTSEASEKAARRGTFQAELVPEKSALSNY